VTYQYQYDTGGRLAGVQIPDVGFVTIGEYTWNRPTRVTLPGGTVREYEYDPLMRVKRITSRDPGSNVLLNFEYSHDKMDNITAKNTEHGDYGYQYDDLYRLTDADDPPAQDDETYTYDTVGNRLTSAGTTSNWTYNQNNELGGYDAVSFEYDANGNMVKKTVGTAVTSYVYNTEDRLAEVWNGEAGTGSLTASYYYDPFGRRLWKEVGGVRTFFHYADEGLIGEYDASGNGVKSYGYKPGSTWTTDPLFMKVGGEYYFYHNDHLGTPQQMTAVNGAVVWRAEYSSFGVAAIEVEAVENHFRLPGQYYDQETGLHYNWHRYYEPGIGRYLRTDPVGLEGGINLFLYAKNSPKTYFDITGLKWCTPWIPTLETAWINTKSKSKEFEMILNSWLLLSIIETAYSPNTAITQ